jgi:hypothetical protein
MWGAVALNGDDALRTRADGVGELKPFGVKLVGL